VTTPTLRERKKQRTRALIAEAAARLFAEHGYESVAVIDVARAADVSEQTVYNYFPTKEQLVLDRDEQLRHRLTELIRTRPPGTSPAAAIREEALGFVAEVRGMTAEQLRGGLGHLGARSPTVRRLSLEMTDRHADAIADVLAPAGTDAERALAKLHAVALTWVFQTITDETGRRVRAGRSPAQIARALRPIVAAMLGDLDRWMSGAATPSPPTGGRRTAG
jgi:AcrR family transcriptional regulator